MIKATLLATAATLALAPPAAAGKKHVCTFDNLGKRCSVAVENPLRTTKVAFSAVAEAGTVLQPVFRLGSAQEGAVIIDGMLVPGNTMYMDCHAGAHCGVILRLTFTFYDDAVAIVDNPNDGRRALTFPLAPHEEYFVFSPLAEPGNPTLIGPQIHVPSDDSEYVRHNIEIIGIHWVRMELLSTGDPIGEDSRCGVRGSVTLVGHPPR